MVGTRMLARLLAHADHAAAKLVLVGDPHQLPEIDAGGIFRGLVHRLDAVELVDNRRQREPWEREALDQLRDGDVATAVSAYRAHGRIVTADCPHELRERLVDAWWAAREVEPDQTGLMIAGRRGDVDDLNARARHRLAEAGHLTGPSLCAGGRSFQTGDEVLFVRNDRRLGVVNGQRGFVRDLDEDRLQVLTAERVVTVDRGYLDDGYLHHGYATTVHKAQGLTVDRAWVLGSDLMYREWSYVALSRGRHHNALYLLGSDAGDASVALTRRSAQHLAMERGTPASTVRVSERELPPTAKQRRLGTLRTLREEAEQQLQAATDNAATAHACVLHAQAGIGRLSRRRQISDLRHSAAYADTVKAQWEQRLDDLEEGIDQLQRSPEPSADDREVATRHERMGTRGAEAALDRRRHHSAAVQQRDGIDVSL